MVPSPPEPSPGRGREPGPERSAEPGSGHGTDLAHAELEPVAYLGNASNVTVLVRVGGGEAPEHAVYKPRAGERPLWDFDEGTLCQREVAAHVVSEFLGWGLVPETILRDGPLGPGSVQRFVDHDPRCHYFTLVTDERHHEQLVRMALFDLLVNNADRKASHVLLGEGERLYGCDHGLTFHLLPKLRTVIWDFAGAPLAAWHDDLGRLVDALRGSAPPAAVAPALDLAGELAALLAPEEIEALTRRAELLRNTSALPDVPEDRRPYPWPLV